MSNSIGPNFGNQPFKKDLNSPQGKQGDAESTHDSEDAPNAVVQNQSSTDTTTGDKLLSLANHQVQFTAANLQTEGSVANSLKEFDKLAGRVHETIQGEFGNKLSPQQKEYLVAATMNRLMDKS